MNASGEIVLGELQKVDRGLVYERIAWLCEGIRLRVVWVSPYKHAGSCAGSDLHGYVIWNDGWEVRIASGLAVNREANTFAHELAHILLGHVKQTALSPSELEAGLAHNTKKHQGGDGEYAEKEKEADELSHKLLKGWEEWGLRQ